MLQADPIADPGSQGLNRYSYVANNPLTLTDPSGYSWFSNILRTVAGVAIAIWAPELLGPYLGTFGSAVAAGFIAGYVSTGNLQGALTGAFSAGLFSGIGAAFDSGGFANSWATSGGDQVFGTNYNLAGFSAKVLSHGVAGGVMSSLEGGKFGSGFASAGIAESFSGAIDKIDTGNPIGQSISAQRVVAAAILGGTASAVAGGKFGNGAVTGAFSRPFNEESSIMKLNKENSAAVSRATTAVLRYNENLTTDEFLRAYPGTEELVPGDADLSVSMMKEQFRFELGGFIANSTSRFLLQQIADSIGDIPRDMLIGVLAPEAGVAGDRLKTFYDIFTTSDTASSLVTGSAVVFCNAASSTCGFAV